MLGCSIKDNCPLVRPGPVRECHPSGSFYGILACIYASFRENHGKLRIAKSTSATGFEPGTSRLPVLSATTLPQELEKLAISIVNFKYEIDFQGNVLANNFKSLKKERVKRK